MSGDLPLLVRTWRVGSRTVTLSVPRPSEGRVSALVVEWEPTQPAVLTSRERRQYRRGRNRALAEVAAALGVNAALVEV